MRCQILQVSWPREPAKHLYNNQWLTIWHYNSKIIWSTTAYHNGKIEILIQQSAISYSSPIFMPNAFQKIIPVIFQTPLSSGKPCHKWYRWKLNNRLEWAWPWWALWAYYGLLDLSRRKRLLAIITYHKTTIPTVSYGRKILVDLRYPSMMRLCTLATTGRSFSLHALTLFTQLEHIEYANTSQVVISLRLIIINYKSHIRI